MKINLLTLLGLLLLTGFSSQAQSSWAKMKTIGNEGVPNYAGVSFAINGKGYMGTGQDILGLKRDFWEYDPTTDVWTQVADFMGSGRRHAVGFAIGSKGYVGTGYDGTYKKDFYEYDPSANMWAKKTDLGGTIAELERYEAVGFGLNGKGYVGLGNSRQSGDFGDFWEYDPNSDSWTKKADFAGGVRDAAIGFGMGSKGYVGTGRVNGSPSMYKNDFYEYDPVGNSWTQKMDFGGVARAGATGFVIGTKGYIGNGIDAGNTRQIDLWEYDATQNAWTKKADFPGQPVTTTTAFVIGTKGFVACGSRATNVFSDDVWEYDQPSDTWTQKSDFGNSARYGAFSFAIDGKVYGGSGYDGLYKTDFWQFDPATQVWTQMANFAGIPRRFPVSFSIDQTGYVGTGEIAANFLKDFWKYSPATNTWSQLNDFPNDGRHSAVSFVIGNKAYMGTGSVLDVPTKEFWEYDAAADSWTKKTDFPGSARIGASGFSIGAKGYIGLGFDGVDKSDFYEYDPVSGNWSAVASFAGAARQYAASFSIGSRGYVGTGQANSTLTKDFWEFNPQTNAWVQEKDFPGDARKYAVGLSTGEKGYIGFGQALSSLKNGLYQFTPAASILTTTQTTSVCVGANIDVDFTAAGSFNGGNMFKAELSDASGSFASPVEIGTMAGTSSGTIASTIPANTAPGTAYRIRVVSTNPAVTGLDNGVDIEVSTGFAWYLDADADGYYVSGPVNSCTSPGPGYTLTVTAGGDCDDSNPNVNPGATEICDNGIDDDCNGTVDDGCNSCSGTAPTGVLYVNQALAVSGDGMSWATAMKELRDAITYANTHPATTQIWVAKGTYKPTNGTNRTVSMTIKRNSLKIIGGFSGVETCPELADPIQNLTVASGDIGTLNNPLDNSTHIFTITGVPAGGDDVVIENMLIEKGAASISSGGNHYGAGVFAYNNPATAGIVLRRVILQQNNSSYYGGAIALYSSPMMIDSTIILFNGAANGGGGIYAFRSTLKTSRTLLQSNISKDGAGIYADNSTLDIQSSVFNQHSASSAGGAVYQNQSPATYTNTVFSQNTAKWSGGAVYQHYSMSEYINSTFYGNDAVTNGGAILAASAPSAIKAYNTIFHQNTRGGNSGLLGSDVYVANAATSMFKNCMLQNNTMVMADDGTLRVNNVRNTDPQFTNQAMPAGADGIFLTPDDGLQLMASSPAINSGDNSFVPAAVMTDIIGQPRISCSTVDRGAYEAANCAPPSSVVVSNQLLTTETKELDALVINPFSNELRIIYKGDQRANVLVYDANGKLMTQQPVAVKGQTRIATGLWSNGFYKILVVDEKQHRKLLTAVKQ